MHDIRGSAGSDEDGDNKGDDTDSGKSWTVGHALSSSSSDLQISFFFTACACRLLLLYC